MKTSRWAGNGLLAIAACAILVLMPGVALGQISVPSGFTFTKIAPSFGGRLTAINDAAFGVGVIDAVVENDIVTLRRISPSGDVTVMVTFSAPGYVRRIRHDNLGIIDGNVHMTVVNDTAEGVTRYYTVSSGGEVNLRWSEGGRPSNVFAFDFDFVSDFGGLTGAKLLDGCSTGGTALAQMDTSYTFVVEQTNSVPAGRNDTDVRGMQRDLTGAYGGGILLADSEDEYELTTLWELRPDNTYRIIGSAVPWTERFYTDLAVVAAGVHSGVVYVNESVSDSIQQVDPNGVHTPWATGFINIDSLSISPDGQSMYVSDATGIYLIREQGEEPGPTVIARTPDTHAGGALVGPPITSIRLVFSEPVVFDSNDVTVTNSAEESVTIGISGSGSQFMLISLGTPLSEDTYSIGVTDSVVSASSGLPIDGNEDGLAGGDYASSLTHGRQADLDRDGDVDLEDLLLFQAAFTGP